jgi:hypothetical protein
MPVSGDKRLDGKAVVPTDTLGAVAQDELGARRRTVG